MYWHEATQQYIYPDVPFTIGEIQYPANWLELSSDNDKSQLGLQYVVTVGGRKDESLYTNTEELVGAELRIINTPKPEPTAREKILLHIEELEAQAKDPRLMREAILGITESVQILSGIQTLIEAERVKLHAL